ncbi:MAG: nickel pincer cofactor biosynthesis protein LarB [Methanolinea sp.]|jgi:NCAIR mutase (PurE)-related protein|nr:nickel pincer cofactor biosynthesis protein LarB [Methanolinea sp.]
MVPNRRLREVLTGFSEGCLTLEEAAAEIEGLRIEEVEDLARLDLGRAARCGIPEVILAEGKAPAELVEIAKRAVQASRRTIISRMSPDHVRVVREACKEIGALFTWHEKAAMGVLSEGSPVVPGKGIVAVISAGTSDLRVAEEARVIAEEMGCTVRTAYDVGVAGIHRLFPALRKCLDAHVFVVAAGREGTLPAIVAGLVDRPVIGVPVSTGYGYMGGGQAALASMLQSCAVIAVVNIDAGVVAGAFAARIANMVGDT